MQLGRFFIFDDSSKSLRDSIKKGCLADFRVTDECDLEPEVVVVDLTSWQLLLLLEEQGLVRRRLQSWISLKN
jgi:hypothetical protein